MKIFYDLKTDINIQILYKKKKISIIYKCLYAKT